MTNAADDVLIRPMRDEDVPVVERLSSTTYLELDLRTVPRSWPEPEGRSPGRAEKWVERTRRQLVSDAGGCWVAELATDDGAEIVGFATSQTRELMWVLSSYGVRPGLQGRGIGRQLLEAATYHGRGCLRAMLSASRDPLAVRRYHQAGFTLHPQMYLAGKVDRSVLPVLEKTREGSAGDIDLMNSVDRQTRGAAHLGDHELLLRQYRLVVSDTSTGSGYVYVDGLGSPQLLAATNRRTATRLLWEALAASDPLVNVDISHVTAANSWAVDVGMAARMELHTSGYLALRGMRPPAPYVHHGALL
ncbi:MAG: GNAT family N-acetyltransferase [Nocardioides sp.]